MKKFAKMSLVAAVAVAGVVSTSSAKDLAEAIKGVDVSGTIVYRYDDRKADNEGKNSNDFTQNVYKLVVNTKAPVNDDITANASVSANNNFGGFNTGEASDSNVDIELTKVNFAYSGIKNTTVIVGKQGIPTPWTVASDSDSAEHTGTGALALSTWGPVTVAAAYFNQTNLDQNNAKTYGVNAAGTTKVVGTLTNYFDGAEDVMTVGVMANVGPVALDAWYIALDEDSNAAATMANPNALIPGQPATIADTKDQVDVSFDSYTVGAKYSVKISEVALGLNARYTALEFDEKATGVALGGAGTDNAMWNVGLSAKMGIVGAAVTYAETDEDGGLTALDNDAKSGLQGWTTNLNGVRDAEMIKTNINVQVLPELNIALNYNEVDSDAIDAHDHEEVYTQITYNMSKNFMTYIRLGTNEQDGEDADIGRLQVQYTF